jgi:hypothetical protein
MSNEKTFLWERPQDGDSVCICQYRGIGDPVIKWDENRYGFSVGGTFRNSEGDFDYHELAFLSEQDLDEDRFCQMPQCKVI